ncbi:hypothetical protein [Streptomyces sp. NPDC054842]
MFVVKVVLTVCVGGAFAVAVWTLAAGRVPVSVLGLEKLPRPRWWAVAGFGVCAGSLTGLWVDPRYGSAVLSLGVGLLSLARKPRPPELGAGADSA